MVFPKSNLPSGSVPWGREIQKRIEDVDSKLASLAINDRSDTKQLQDSYRRLDATVQGLKEADVKIIDAVALATSAAAQANTAAQQANDAIAGLGNLDQSTSTYKINADNLTVGTINGNTINVTNLNADNITSGSISADRINAGTIDTSNINITSGSYSLTVGNSSSDAYLNVIPGSTLGVALNKIGFQSTSTAGWWSNCYPYYTNSVYCGLAAYAWEGIRSHTAVVVTSDERTKNSITNSDLGLDFINLLRPVSYKYNVGKNEITYDDNGEIIGTVPQVGNRVHYGLIAQEVKQALDSVNAGDFGGWILDDLQDPDSPQALRYEEFISPLIKAVQELSARVKQLEGN